MTFPEQYAAVIRYGRDLDTLRAAAAHAADTGSNHMLLDYLQDTEHPLSPLAAASVMTGHESPRNYMLSPVDLMSHHPDGNEEGTPEYQLSVSAGS